MSIRKTLVGLATIGGILAATITPAFADGSGYAPPGSGTSAGSTAGTEFSTVLAAQTVGTTGATLTGTSGPDQASVSIPAGTFSAPVQVSLTTGAGTSSVVPSGDSFVTEFGINFTGATPNKPITLTITNPAIPANAEVFKVTNSGLTKVNATVKNGKVTVTFQNDPNFVVVQPKSGYVAQATSPVTGLPIVNEIGGGVAIALVGGTMVLMSLRKKQTN